MILEASSDDPGSPLSHNPVGLHSNVITKSPEVPVTYLADSFGGLKGRNKSAKVSGELRTIRDVRHRFDLRSTWTSPGRKNLRMFRLASADLHGVDYQRPRPGLAAHYLHSW